MYTTTELASRNIVTGGIDVLRARSWRPVMMVALPLDRAQSGHFCPTGVSIEQSAQIGFPQSEQDR
jgi:hypothetical protein